MEQTLFVEKMHVHTTALPCFNASKTCEQRETGSTTGIMASACSPAAINMTIVSAHRSNSILEQCLLIALQSLSHVDSNFQSLGVLFQDTILKTQEALLRSASHLHVDHMHPSNGMPISMADATG